MKKIFLFLFVLHSAAGFSQSAPTYANPQPSLFGIKYQRVKSDSFQHAPRLSALVVDRDTTPYFIVYNDSVWWRINGAWVNTMRVDTTSISNFSVKVRSLFSATSPLNYNNGAFNIIANSIDSSYMVANFHTTPWYDLRYAPIVGGGYVPTSRTITVNGSTLDLSANRSWTVTTTGTSGKIDVSGGAGLTPTISISATYAGQTSITTLGTIITGVWNGTAITDTYISSAATWNAKQAALSGTGFVKISGTTISYDNSTYLTTTSAASTYLTTSSASTTYLCYSCGLSSLPQWTRNTNSIAYFNYANVNAGSGAYTEINLGNDIATRGGIGQTSSTYSSAAYAADQTYVFGLGSSGLKLHATTGPVVISTASTNRTTWDNATGNITHNANISLTGTLTAASPSYGGSMGSAFPLVRDAAGLISYISAAQLKTFASYYTSGDNVSLGTGTFSGLMALSNTGIHTVGGVNFMQAISGYNQLFSGTSGFNVNNSGNTRNNLAITDAGNATVYGTLTTGGGVFINSASASSGAGYYNYLFTSGNAASRTWRTAIDYSAYGDWVLQQATTQGGSTYVNALRFDASLNATFSNQVNSNIGFNVIKDGSGSAAGGGFYGFSNVAGTRAWLQQLNASNNIDLWYYNGTSYVVKQTFGNDGSIAATSLQINSYTDGAVAATSSGNAFGFQTTGAATTKAGYIWHTAASGDNIFLQFFTDAGASNRGSISYNRAGGLVAYNTTSDRRAKTILGAVENPGSKIDSIKVYNAIMKGATLSRPMFIADELQTILPYAVTGKKDAVDEAGKPIFQQVDASTIVPLLVAEIQALRKRIITIEQKLKQ